MTVKIKQYKTKEINIEQRMLELGVLDIHDAKNYFGGIRKSIDDLLKEFKYIHDLIYVSRASMDPEFAMIQDACIRNSDDLLTALFEYADYLDHVLGDDYLEYVSERARSETPEDRQHPGEFPFGWDGDGDC